MTTKLFPNAAPEPMVADREKLKQVLLYILEETKDRANVGKTVINKLLYFVDFDHFELHFESLTGETYIRKQHGPTSQQLEGLLEELVGEGLIQIQERDYMGRRQEKIVPLQSFKPVSLTKGELAHIDEVLERLADKNATELSEYSHEDVPYLAAEDREALSYPTVFYREDEYSARIRRGVDLDAD